MEGIHNESNLLLAHFSGKWHENAWLTQVAIILGNLVLQNQMVAKSIPSQFREQPVILVRILAIMGEDEVRRNRLFQLFKYGLHFCSRKGQESVLKVLENRALQIGSPSEPLGALPSLFSSNSQRAEYDPVEYTIGV